MLEHHSGFHTSNADVVRTALVEDLGATHFDVFERNNAFSLGLHWSKRRNATLVSSVCNGVTEVKYSPATFVRQYFELSPTGRYRFSFSNSIKELSQTSASIIVPSDTTFGIEATANTNLLVLRIEQDVLDRNMRTMLGGDGDYDVRFEKPSEIDTPRQRSMRQAVIQFATDLDLWVPDMASVAHTELEQALIIRFLLCNNHNYSAKLQARPQLPSSSQLHLIEEYIEANWETALDIEQLATISNVSARSIFRHFRTARGVSPLEYVKTVRLKHARRMLQVESKKTSVMSIALKCGFQSFGHFARDYRKAFGELPSETLRHTLSPRKPQL